MLKIILLVALSVVSTAWAYSGGAPEGTCDDMTPKHPVDPQRSKFPYKISVSKNEIKAGEKVDITVGGSKSFKGFLMQVRDDNKKAVGQFVIPDNSKYAKNMACHGNKAVSMTSSIFFCSLLLGPIVKIGLLQHFSLITIFRDSYPW